MELIFLDLLDLWVMTRAAQYLKSFDSCIYGFHRLEAERRLDEPFQFTVIGLDEIVQVFDLAVHSVGGAFALGFKGVDGLLYRPLLYRC